MKKIYRTAIIGILLVIISGLATPLISGELDKPYNPSRREWLELTLFKLIKDKTDLWNTRVGFTLWVIEKDGEILITISEANGQEPFNDSARANYVKDIKSAVESFIQKFEWAKNLDVIVQ